MPRSHLGRSLPLTIRNFAFNLWVIKTNAILYDPVFKLHELWNHNTRDPRVNAVRPAMPLAQSAHKHRYSVKIAVAFVRSCCCYLDHLCYRADWDHRLCDPIDDTSSWNRGYKYRSPAANYFGISILIAALAGLIALPVTLIRLHYTRRQTLA